MPKRIVIVGTPGCGKTTWVKDHFLYEDCFYLSNSKWWDGYVDQKVLVLDEFKGWVNRDTWLKIYDDSPLRVELKGSSLEINPQVVITISNYPMEEWWKDIKPQWKAVTRRVDRYLVPDGHDWGIFMEYLADPQRHVSGYEVFCEETGYIPAFQPMEPIV